METIRLGTIGQTLGVVTAQLDAVERGLDYARQDLADIKTAQTEQETK